MKPISSATQNFFNSLTTFVLASGFGLFAQPCEFTAQVAEPFVEGRILHPQVVVFGDRIDGLRAESL